LSRVTGIDDGNEETTLDFGIKKGMNKGTMTNVDLSVGTKDRYAERLMGAYMKDNVRVMAFANANNVGNMGFGGGRGGNFGRGQNGLNTHKMMGVNFNYEDKGLLKMNGSVRWNHNNSDARSKTSAENFVSKTGAFSNSLNQNYSRSNSWNAQMRLEWTPDTMTNIMFRPSWSYTTNDGLNRSSSASYNVDPYLYVVDPLAAISLAQLDQDSLVVNSRSNASISYSDSKRVGGMLQLNRKLNSMGRNVTLRADASMTKGDSKSLSTSNVTLYQVPSRKDPTQDSTYYTNRYNLTPTRNHSYSLQATYSEPLWKATYLQFSYKFTYSYSKSDRSTYDFSELGYDFSQGITPLYRTWDNYLTRLPSPFETYRNDMLSRFSEYQNYTHNIEMMFRMVRDNYNFNAGVLIQPQKSHFRQDYQGHKADTVRTVTNITPTLNFRYRFSKVSQLRINYRGSTSQPSMTQLLDITDDSDPLNISKGNPGLKPSFTNNLSLFYNNYIQSHQRFVMANLRFSTTRNSISNMVTYNDSTGGRTTRPENINGNWNIASTFVFNTSIDTTGVWNVNTSTDYSFANSVAYVSVDRNSSSQKNYTKTHTISERLATSLRPQWGDWSTEFELDGSLTYTHSRNHLQSQSNLDTWRFAYGGSINITAPWGTSLSTDMHMNSRRGFNDKSMNTNELIWNAQIGQGFLKGKALTFTLQFYDILHRQSNFSRSINAIQRSDTEYNSINSYAMLHVVYRLNLFGGKAARQNMGGPGGEGPRGNRPGNDGGGFGGGRPGGGFGGGRPGNFM
ncbi:MAG: outer membrane beta-barrel protein, partial [Prevotella sp.]|nr:outer membrane beta-barrel protein [Prevotella sp.]